MIGGSVLEGVFLSNIGGKESLKSYKNTLFIDKAVNLSGAAARTGKLIVIKNS